MSIRRERRADNTSGLFMRYPGDGSQACGAQESSTSCYRRNGTAARDMLCHLEILSEPRNCDRRR